MEEKMDMTILELVTQVGFPIAACIGLFVLYDRSLKGFTETLTKMETMLEELSGFIRNLDTRLTGQEKGEYNAPSST